MRGGPFSETRVIELLNTRFVPFYFNVGGPGQGHDAAATEFVRGKLPNRYAYFAAFAPDGTILGQTGTYGGTTEVFAWLRALLRRHPEFDRPTAEEAALLAKVGTEMSAADAAAVAWRCEQITKYTEAGQAWRRLLAVGDTDERALAFCGLLRIARAEGDWRGHANTLAVATASAEGFTLATDLAIERGLRHLADRRYANARVVLEAAIAAAQASPRLAELHYEAGRACWFLGDRDWAKAHWCWILDQRPDDRMAMRARLAAGAEVFPYPNAELGNFEPNVGPVGPGALDAGVRAAQRVYERLRPRLLGNDWDLASARVSATGEAEVATAPPAAPGADPLDAPDSLVARLGNSVDAAAENKLIDAIVAAGAPAAETLSQAAANTEFRGRRAAVVAIGKLLTVHPTAVGSEPRQWFQQVLFELRRETGELGAAARTSLGILEGRGTSPGAAPVPTSADAVQVEVDVEAAPLPTGAFSLVAALRDGNDYRIANNRLVAALELVGEGAVPPLLAAIGDREFLGRGYAALALGKVLHKVGTRPAVAVEALEAAAGDGDPYVAALARSGLKLLLK